MHMTYSRKSHSQVCKEFSGYTSNDTEIFITAYEITASIIKQTRANRAHPPLLGQKKCFLALKLDRGIMRDINNHDNDRSNEKKSLIVPSFGGPSLQLYKSVPKPRPNSRTFVRAERWIQIRHLFVGKQVSLLQQRLVGRSFNLESITNKKNK